MAGLAAVLVCLALLAIVAVRGTNAAAERSQRAVLLSQAYDGAQNGAAEEEAKAADYLLALGPGARSLNPPELRRAHRLAASTVTGAMGQVVRLGDDEDRALAKRVVDEHRGYLQGTARLFAAVDGGQAGRALDVRLREVEPAFADFEGEVRQAAERTRENARDTLRNQASTEHLAYAATLVAFAIGLGLLALFTTVLRDQRRRLDTSRRKELKRMERAALVDGLTGLRNHRAFQEDLARELQRYNRLGSPLTLALIDINDLKQVNDTLGLEAGDGQLIAFAACLADVVRESDAAYRTGGDEFATVLSGSNAWGGLRFIQRLQQELSEIASADPPTVTVGIAEAAGPTTREALLEQAAAALKEAKRSHRESVIYTTGLEVAPLAVDSIANEHHLKTLATALARAVDAKDSWTRSHCETVSELCVVIAKELGFDAERTGKMRLAGLLHDVGKIGIPDAILQKPARLTVEEFEVMKTHASLGHRIVRGAELTDQADWILHHHERLDGAGYPHALRGEEVPLESRIILVADAFEALTSDRPYRPGRPEEEALLELDRHAGTQFDANCVAALRRALDHGALAPVVVGPGEEPSTFVSVDAVATELASPRSAARLHRA